MGTPVVAKDEKINLRFRNTRNIYMTSHWGKMSRHLDELTSLEPDGCRILCYAATTTYMVWEAAFVKVADFYGFSRQRLSLIS